ncbi:carboxymuconolactone decarboxylase family protein [Advenella mimigardefordensis]|uniref:Putative 4-carboxymuconolactone decarboxylase n=1 Tax=Advenella mimigardefordensis (strain DSM 17166 / LMG 22922 / DPN7) TaxID=1247726 RepID=W0PIT4_ADVMD|nr:carboxymuconolactone decarboxylase family protein [Advenella mimigardefordensis]AHG65887.1 putative 4-carboxymuconolactone decarboxylase [Advenella mimigardefordensis DPN7]
MTDITPDQEQIRAYFIAERGYWRPWTQAILRHNPLFLKGYAAYAGYPARHGPLSTRMIELIYIALDSSATHLYPAGLRTHMDFARQCGVTAADVFDVLHIVAGQGLSHVYDAVRILAEESGVDAGHVMSEAQRSRVLRHFSEVPAFMEQIAQLDPGYLDVLLDFLEEGGSRLATSDAGLTPAERVLIEVALAACFTGFNETMLRIRIRSALQMNISQAELLQAIQLTAHLSIHGTALGANTFEEHIECQTKEHKHSDPA